MKPGEIITKEGNITINKDLKVFTLTVSNSGDRPVQVGSHYHFAEANEKLDFDRKTAHGKRLNIPSGTAVRFEPCLLYTSPSPRDMRRSRMPSSA